MMNKSQHSFSIFLFLVFEVCIYTNFQMVWLNLTLLKQNNQNLIVTLYKRNENSAFIEDDKNMSYPRKTISIK